jgi:ribose transport system substrate-binding protein
MKKVTRRQPYSVPVLMHALDVLEFLRGCDIPVKPDEISNATGVSRTTTYRILHTFVRRGYVAQDPGGKFSFLSPPAKTIISSQTESGSGVDDQKIRNIDFI